MREVKYRKCPWCGAEYARCFPRHIASHGKTLEDYVLYINNLTELPKCPVSWCNEKCHVVYSGYYISVACCPSHELYYRAEAGYHQFSHENRPKDEFGNDIIMKGITERGNNAFSKQNRILDENGKDIMALKGAETRNRLNINPFQSCNLIYDKNGGTNISKLSRESHIINGSFIHISDSQDPLTLYVGRFNKENLLKVGTSRNIYKRLDCYKSANIIFDSFDEFKSTEYVLTRLEKSIYLKFYNNLINLPDTYTPKNTFMTLGYTEWYDINIYNELIKYIKASLTN